MCISIRTRIKLWLVTGIMLTLLVVPFSPIAHAGVIFEPFSTQPAIDGGNYNTYVLRSDGTVWAWGSNGYGQLGSAGGGSFNPVQVEGLKEVVAIASGMYHALALKNDGTVWAWGMNYYGQLGIGGTADAFMPVQVTALSDVVAIAAGQDHSLALKSDGTVWSWGYNARGQLGYDTTATVRNNSEEPVRIIELAYIKAIAAGHNHSLALKNDGTVWTWGGNVGGELGYDTGGIGSPHIQPKQMDPSYISDVIAIAGGDKHSVALKQDGTVWAWGDNSYGQLGYGLGGLGGGYEPRQVMKTVMPDEPLTNATAISAGSFHTLALINDGSVWAWGKNENGEIGDGTFADKLLATQVSGPNNVIAIGAGFDNPGKEHSLVIKKNGSVLSWGGNSWRKLGYLSPLPADPEDSTNRAGQVPDISAINPVVLSGPQQLTYEEWSTAPIKVRAVFTNSLGIVLPDLTLRLTLGPGLTTVDDIDVVWDNDIMVGSSPFTEWRVQPTRAGTYPVTVEAYRTGGAAPFAAASYTIVAEPGAAGAGSSDGGDPAQAAYAVTFNSNGGSPVDVQQVNAGDAAQKPADPVRDGYSFVGWYSDSELTAEFDFTTRFFKDVTLYAKWKDSRSYIPITIGGKVHERIVSYVVLEEEGRTALTATADSAQLKEQLAKAGQRPAVVVPVKHEADGVTIELTGDAVQALENSGAILDIRTRIGGYKLPAAEIRIGDLARQLGGQERLSEAIVRVSLAKGDSAASKQLEQTAAAGGFTVVAPSVDFAITVSYSGKTASVDKFGSFVKRMFPLAGSARPDHVTTAVALKADGQVRPVPTYTALQDGSYYAVFHSLTNSQYAIISPSVAFADVEGHWSQQAVNDLASRQVIQGVDRTHFRPDAPITRAAFAAIIVRALGLADSGTTSAFTDVKAGDWYVGAVAKAQEYRLVDGYEDNTFRPNETITRQEAVAVMTRALKLAGVEASMGDTEANAILSEFADAADVSAWAKHAFAASVKLQLVVGNASLLHPTAEITRAEAAVIVRRALETAKLIDIGKS